MSMTGLRRSNHFLLRRVGTAHQDILSDGSSLQPRLLQHHTVSAAQASSRNLADILALYADAAALYIIETHEQVDDSSLAAACRADNGDTLTGLDGEIEIPDQRTLRIVGELDIRERNVALDIRPFPESGAPPQ